MGGVGKSSRAWAVSTLLAASAHAGTVWVALPERAAPCELEQVAVALRARLPGAQVLPGHPSELSSPQVVLDRTSDAWTLEVRAPGHPALKRDLPDPGSDCVALSEAAALMTDRYLESIQWSAGAVSVDPFAPAEGPPDGGVAESTPLQGVAEIGGGIGLGDLGVAPVAQLDLGAAWGAWRFEAAGLYQAPGQLTLVGPTTAPGFLHEQVAAFQAAAGRRFELGWGALRVEATPGAELFWVWGSGTRVFQRKSALSALPFLGLRLGYELTFARRLSVCLRVQARAPLGQDQFSVQGYLPTITTQRVDGDAGLALGYLFF
jgi:hypothetical protein